MDLDGHTICLLDKDDLCLILPKVGDQLKVKAIIKSLTKV